MERFIEPKTKYKRTTICFMISVQSKDHVGNLQALEKHVLNMIQ